MSNPIFEPFHDHGEMQVAFQLMIESLPKSKRSEVAIFFGRYAETIKQGLTDGN